MVGSTSREVQGRGSRFHGAPRGSGRVRDVGSGLPLPPSLACAVDPFLEKETEAPRLEVTCGRSTDVRRASSSPERCQLCLCIRNQEPP